MMTLPIITAIAAVGVAHWLAVRGLVRLDGNVALPDCMAVLGAAGAGGLMGVLCWALLLRSGAGFSTQMALCLVSMPLLITAAWVDLTTRWAPRELMLPIACLTLMIAMGGPAGSVVDHLLGAAAGTALYLAARLAWIVQIRGNWPHLPPADLMSMLLPVFLFGATHVAGLYYLLLALVLIGVRWAGSSSGAGWIATPAGTGQVAVPLLALTCPLLALFMLLAARWPGTVP